jgi:hypothetical protein
MAGFDQGGGELCTGMRTVPQKIDAGRRRSFYNYTMYNLGSPQFLAADAPRVNQAVDIWG